MKNRNNTAEFSGIVKTEPVLGHNIYKEDFYHFDLMIPRLSGVSDILPVTFSWKLIDKNDLMPGDVVHILGQVRSYNKIVELKNRLDIRIFALEIEKISEEDAIEIETKPFTKAIKLNTNTAATKRYLLVVVFIILCIKSLIR